jgi:hypothetical protein
MIALTREPPLQQPIELPIAPACGNPQAVRRHYDLLVTIAAFRASIKRLLNIYSGGNIIVPSMFTGRQGRQPNGAAAPVAIARFRPTFGRCPSLGFLPGKQDLGNQWYRDDVTPTAINYGWFLP